MTHDTVQPSAHSSSNESPQESEMTINVASWPSDHSTSGSAAPRQTMTALHQKMLDSRQMMLAALQQTMLDSNRNSLEPDSKFEILPEDAQDFHFWLAAL